VAAAAGVAVGRLRVVAPDLPGALPAPEVVRLPGAGHLPNLEAPAAFDAALRAFALRVLAA
jgi:pimeloyl-ACP methyl ester carboxylesterase